MTQHYAAKKMKNSPIDWVGHAFRRAGNKILTYRGIKGAWIDVGAHHGETTLEWAVRNPGLRIYAFEPNLRVAVSLVGRAANFFVIPMAVAETDGCAQLHINAHDAASSLLAMDENAKQNWIGGESLRIEGEVTVPTIRLDTFMNLLEIGSVDFMKVDTQGLDLAVIRFAGSRLRDIKKITLEADVTSKRLYQGSASKEEIVSFLNAQGFRLVLSEQQSHGQEENLTFQCSPSR